MSETDLSKLCLPLQNLLQHEISRGNKVKAVETGWSRVSLAVRLNLPLDMKFVKETVRNNPDLEIWESRDIKNPVEIGILCKSAGQSLSGNLVDR
jgi:hypothetical protein